MCLSLFLCPVGVCGHQGTDGTVVCFSKDSFLISCVIFFSFSQACFCPSWPAAPSTLWECRGPWRWQVRATGGSLVRGAGHKVHSWAGT